MRKMITCWTAGRHFTFADTTPFVSTNRSWTESASADLLKHFKNSVHSWWHFANLVLTLICSYTILNFYDQLAAEPKTGDVGLVDALQSQAKHFDICLTDGKNISWRCSDKSKHLSIHPQWTTLLLSLWMQNGGK